MIEAINNYNGLSKDESKVFTISNGVGGTRVSNINIINKNSGNDNWVKNGDDIEIIAGVTGGSNLGKDDIIADLSGFGRGNHEPSRQELGFTDGGSTGPRLFGICSSGDAGIPDSQACGGPGRIGAARVYPDIADEG